MIPADEIVTIPAVQAKTFNESWVYNLIVHAPSVSNSRVTIELLPYNRTTNELGPGEMMQSFSTDKLWEAVAEVPEMAAAFAAVIAAVPPMKAWILAKQQEAQEQQ